MISATIFILSTLGFRAVNAFGRQQVAARAFQPQPDANCTKCFHIINLFSYDQQQAIEADAAIPGGPEHAQNNFVQFYLNDPGQPENGGASISWDPNYNSPGDHEKPPIGVEKQLESDSSEKAELTEWNGPNDFKVSVTHSFKDTDSGEDRVRQADLVINDGSRLGEGNKWDCQKGSCRFSGPPYLWYPIYFCECYPGEEDHCCDNKKLNPQGRPKPADGSGVKRRWIA